MELPWVADLFSDTDIGCCAGGQWAFDHWGGFVFLSAKPSQPGDTAHWWTRFPDSLLARGQKQKRSLLFMAHQIVAASTSTNVALHEVTTSWFTLPVSFVWDNWGPQTFQKLFRIHKAQNFPSRRLRDMGTRLNIAGDSKDDSWLVTGKYQGAD